MNTEPETSEFESTAERLADSLLSEHARLGSGNDDELIGKILAKTVAKASITPARPVFGLRNWMIMGTSVAAVVALLLLALSNFHLKDNRRTSDTFQFVVKVTGSLPARETGNKPEPTPKESPRFVKSKPYEGELNPVTPTSSEIVLVKIEDRDLQLSSEFTPSLTDVGEERARVQSITISANIALHEGEKMQYSGKVIVTHADFTLTADELDVLLDKVTGSLIARGDSELKLTSGEIRKLDPEKEELVLNGDTYLIRALKYEDNASPLLESR